MKKQPGIRFLYEVSVFDPKQVASMDFSAAKKIISASSLTLFIRRNGTSTSSMSNEADLVYEKTPVEWWRRRIEQFPTMGAAALRTLPAGSAAVECIFTRAVAGDGVRGGECRFLRGVVSTRALASLDHFAFDPTSSSASVPSADCIQTGGSPSAGPNAAGIRRTDDRRKPVKRKKRSAICLDDRSSQETNLHFAAISYLFYLWDTSAPLISAALDLITFLLCTSFSPEPMSTGLLQTELQ